MSINTSTVQHLIHELKLARQELQVLRAIADTVSAFSLALNSEPPRRGVGPDVIWDAEKELAEEERKE